MNAPAAIAAEEAVHSPPAAPNPTFRQHVANWRALGYGDALLPAAPPGAKPSGKSGRTEPFDGKIPSRLRPDGWVGLAKWSDPAVSLTDALRDQCPDGTNLCLRTARRFLAVDVDIEDADLAKSICAIAELSLGRAPQRSRANSARKLLLYGRTEPRTKSALVLSRNGEPLGRIELLADGEQFVAEGVHKSGARLEWDRHVQAAELSAVTNGECNGFMGAVAIDLEQKGIEVRQVGSGKPVAVSPLAPIPLEGDYQDIARQRAIDYLACQAPATAGERNDQCFRVAARLRDFGVQDHDCEGILLEHWRCEPMLDGDELAHVVRSAYKYAKGQAGADSPEADLAAFDALDAANDEDPFDTTPSASSIAPVTRRGKAFPTRKASELVPVMDAPTILEGLLTPEGYSVLYGPSNVGKSFLALSMALCMADGGRQWLGRKAKSARVLWIAAEGAYDLPNRVNAWCRHYGADRDSLPFEAVTSVQVDFSSDDHADALAATVRDGGFHVVVVDTLAEAFGSADENSTKDMGRFSRCLTRVVKESRAHVLVIHHSGKQAGNGPRGASALVGSADTVLRVEPGRIWVEKQRSIAKATAPVCFDLQLVELGQTPAGEPVTSCVAVEDSTADPAASDLSGRVLEALRSLIRDAQNDPDTPVADPAISEKAWRKSCTFIPTKNRPRVFNRIVGQLMTAGEVEEVQGHFRIPGGAAGLGLT